MLISNKPKLLLQNPMAWLIGQVLILALCIGYVVYMYYANILPDKEANLTFKPTTCMITSKKLSASGYFSERYRADFLVSYNVNGVQYNRWVSGNGLDNAFVRSSASQKDILVNFDVGESYPCWYHPSMPQIVILVERKDWSSIFPLMVPLAILVVTLYYFAKTLYRILSHRTGSSQKMRKRK